MILFFVRSPLIARSYKILTLDLYCLIRQKGKRTQHRCLTLDLVDGFGQAANITARDTGNADAAVLGGVDAVLLG